MKEFVALAKAKPNQLQYGTGGAGTTGHIAESGFPKFEIVLYSGILGPAGLPAPVINKLSGEIARALATPEIQQMYARLGAVPYTTTPEKFAASLNSEIVRLGAVVRASGADLQ